jgi:hypothetical protein
MKLHFPGSRSATVAQIASEREQYAADLVGLVAAARLAEAEAAAAIARREAAKAALTGRDHSHQLAVGRAELHLRQTADESLAKELKFLRRLFDLTRNSEVIGQPVLERTPSGRSLVFRPSRAAEIEAGMKALRAAERELEQLQVGAATAAEIGKRISELRAALPPLPRDAQMLLDEADGKLPQWPRAAE